MVNKKNITDILPKMGFEQYDYVEPINHSSGLAVLWNNGVVCASILRKEQKAIHMLVHDTEKSNVRLLVVCMHPRNRRIGIPFGITFFSLILSLICLGV